MVHIHELLPGELLVAQRIGGGAVSGCCAEGEPVVTCFCDLPDVLVKCLVLELLKNSSAPAQLKTTLYRESLMLDHPKDSETYRAITGTERDDRSVGPAEEGRIERMTPPPMYSALCGCL